MKILLNIGAVILLMAVMLLASVDLEPQTPQETVAYEPITVETALETEAVFSRESQEIEFETYHVTGYCVCEKCCGKVDGIGAAGIKVVPGVTVAGTLPFGTMVWIDGIGYRTVQDRGAAIGDGEFDVLFETHQEAVEFGSQYLKVRIIDA